MAVGSRFRSPSRSTRGAGTSAVRKALAIYGISEEAASLAPLLEANPEIEIAGVYAPDPEALRSRAGGLAERLDADPALFDRPLHAVIDTETLPPFAETFPECVARGTQVVSPLTARLLWGYGVSARDRKAELLQALREVVESVNLTVDADELFARMLEIAMGVTGADGGSLMLLDPDEKELGIRVAFGVEPELWPKIRVPLGEGVAGRVAAEGRPLRLRGKADREAFRIVRERLDVESALCVPLVHRARVLGVLNLHHSTRADAFDDDDLDFAEQLGRLDAEIIARAEEHASLRRQASRYEAVREVQRALAGSTPLSERLEKLCALLARRVGDGIATVYLHEADGEELRLAATSLEGGGLGGDYRLRPGQGVVGRAALRREPVFLRGAGGGLAYAALPLLAGEQQVGVLSIQGGAATESPSDARAVEETLLEVAAAVADEVAQAEREARMATRATKVGAVNEAGIRLISAREAAEVARIATSSGALILEADHAVLRLQDPESRRFVIRSYYGSADGRTQERLFRLDKRISVEVLKGRTVRLFRNLRHEPRFEPEAGGFHSALAAPLRREGRIVGTLALYDKVAPDPFAAGPFHEDDLQIFSKYVSYVERALENAALHAATRQHRNIDELTGLPSGEYLARRIEQEIARAAGRPLALALVTCRIENLSALRSGPELARGDQVVLRTAEALRAHLRDFDVLARSADDGFSALLPEPGPHPEERVTALARAVADDIAKDEGLNESQRVSLAFGYAVHPDEGESRETLLTRAATARIRMV